MTLAMVALLLITSVSIGFSCSLLVTNNRYKKDMFLMDDLLVREMERKDANTLS